MSEGLNLNKSQHLIYKLLTFIFKFVLRYLDQASTRSSAGSADLSESQQKDTKKV